MPQFLVNVLLHIVFSTKNRAPFLQSPRIRWGLARHCPCNPGLRSARPGLSNPAPLGLCRTVPPMISRHRVFDGTPTARGESAAHFHAVSCGDCKDFIPPVCGENGWRFPTQRSIVLSGAVTAVMCSDAR